MISNQNSKPETSSKLSPIKCAMLYQDQKMNLVNTLLI